MRDIVPGLLPSSPYTADLVPRLETYHLEGRSDVWSAESVKDLFELRKTSRSSADDSNAYGVPHDGPQTRPFIHADSTLQQLCSSGVTQPASHRPDIPHRSEIRMRGTDFLQTLVQAIADAASMIPVHISLSLHAWLVARDPQSHGPFIASHSKAGMGGRHPARQPLIWEFSARSVQL